MHCDGHGMEKDTAASIFRCSTPYLRISSDSHHGSVSVRRLVCQVVIITAQKILKREHGPSFSHPNSCQGRKLGQVQMWPVHPPHSPPGPACQAGLGLEVRRSEL